MKAAKERILLPAILIANDLIDGDVVFRTAAGWSRDPQEARIAHDLDAARVLQGEARAALAANEVVDATLIDVTVSPAGLPVPNHFRERFRIKGPSVRPDLGKQAEYPHLGAV